MNTHTPVRIVSLIISIILGLCYSLSTATILKAQPEALELYATYGCLMDGNTGRVLYGKQEHIPAPMASTTKIMTCIIALEYAPLDLVCHTSSYAASMPEVALGATPGEVFTLKDLLYSLMLKSHNDTAVIIAENVSAYLSTAEPISFIDLMNRKAASLHCSSTHFITPNGLDATDDTGIHQASASDMAKIMAYAIGNKTFVEICNTDSYSFRSNLRSYTVNNANTFRQMYPDIIAGKTGFTCDAGYCYVCAYRDGDMCLIVSLLACGWPYNKNYRYKDARKLLDYGRDNYHMRNICIDTSQIIDVYLRRGYDYCRLPIAIDINKIAKNLQKYINFSKNTINISTLLSDNDIVDIHYYYGTIYDTDLIASAGDYCGSIEVSINHQNMGNIPIYITNTIAKPDIMYYIMYMINTYLLGREEI